MAYNFDNSLRYQCFQSSVTVAAGETNSLRELRTGQRFGEVRDNVLLLYLPQLATWEIDFTFFRALLTVHR